MILLPWVYSFLILLVATSQSAKAIMCDEMERDNGYFSLEYFIYIENISEATISDIKCNTCSLTNGVKIHISLI